MGMVIKSKEILDVARDPSLPSASPVWLPHCTHCGNVPGTGVPPAWLPAYEATG